MQTNETEMGYIATFNHICKKKHVHIFCMFPKIILIVAPEIEFFSFQSIFQDFRRSWLEVCRDKSGKSSCLLTLK